MKTTLVDLGGKPPGFNKGASNVPAPASDPVASKREHYNTESKDGALRTRNNGSTDALRSKVNGTPLSPPKRLGKEFKHVLDEKTVRGRQMDGSDKVPNLLHDTSDSLPTEVIRTLPNCICIFCSQWHCFFFVQINNEKDFIM